MKFRILKDLEIFLCSDFNCFMLLSFTNHEDNRFKIKRKDS